MANPELPQGHASGHNIENNVSHVRHNDESRLEKVLTKGSLWKKQTLRNIESKQDLERSESRHTAHDTDKMERLLARLSAQLDERDQEVERLRVAVSNLKDENSHSHQAHLRELESQRDELERLQTAYDQFEKESDNLISELSEQNERLLNECRYENGRSLLREPAKRN